MGEGSDAIPAVARIWSLAWERTHATGVAEQKERKKEKKKNKTLAAFSGSNDY